MKNITGCNVLIFCFLWYGLLASVPAMLCSLPVIINTENVTDNVTENITAASQRQNTAAEHPLSQLIEHNRNNYAVLLTAFLTGIIVTPLAEEFIFRFILQGYFVRLFGHQTGIIAVSVIFAALHGTSRQEYNDTFFLMICGIGIANLTVFFSGLFYFCFVRQISVTKSLLRFDWTWYGTLQCTGLFLITVPLIFILTFLMRTLYPESLTDPFPLFFFSLVLGAVYHRTERLTACFLMHAGLNALSFAVLLIQ
ncbi:MAG: CPBP family intramembrane metalloprotease [Planctomycetaceae bacterium]|jgi:membrane protease YdiL (CAAX protease family)|nr:CPBP family intramembrane metalloprotease [Planctomycetaceae bacterium]